MKTIGLNINYFLTIYSFHLGKEITWLLNLIEEILVIKINLHKEMSRNRHHK